MLLLLLISFFIQWETEGQDKQDGILTIYKVDRLTGQRWEIKYKKGNADESPVFSEEQIQKSISKMDTNGIEINDLEKEIKNQKKIMDENKDEHEKYIDPNYYGSYEPAADSQPNDNNKSMDAVDSLFKEFENKKLHEKAIEFLAYEHIQYLSANKKVSKLENELNKINNENIGKAIDDLTASTWMIRNGINVLRIGLIALFLILIFLKRKKHVNPYQNEV